MSHMSGGLSVQSLSFTHVCVLLFQLHDIPTTKVKPILSDKIAELIAPRRLLDPEIDSEDETTARAIDYDLDDEFGDTEPNSTLSDIRRKNVKLLHDVDEKYRGKVSSRKELEMDSNESGDSDSENDDNDSEPEVDSHDKSIGELSLALTPKQRIKLAQTNKDLDNRFLNDEDNELGSTDSSEDDEDIKAFAQKLNSSKSKTDDVVDSDSGDDLGTNNREEIEKWDDDYEGEEVEEEESENESLEEGGDDQDEDDDDEMGSDEEESDFDGGDILPHEQNETSEKQDLSRILPKQQKDDQLNKGACVQNQLNIWEKLLEVRIHSQKMLIKANSLPQPTKFEQLAEKSEEFSELANDTADKGSKLVSQMRDLQSLLLNQFTETKEIGSKRKPINFNGMNDSEAKRKRIADQLENDYVNFKDYQYSVISKWHDRTKVLTPGSIKTQKQQGNIDVLRKIEGVLANREELVKKSQLLKGGYELFDKSTGIVEQKSNIVSIDNGENGETENSTDEHIYSNEIYDDTDFYHTQLRELIEYKTSSSSNANEMAKQFAELQKLRKKMKKTVDTRASKGRKIRYVVHNKLVSFMAPNDPGNWTDEQRDELFKSLFGAQS